MLIAAGSTIPKAVEDQLRDGESPSATLLGLLESGMAATHDRLFAWRSTGAVSPLPLRAIERILIDVGDGMSHLQVVVVPNSGVLPPLVLLRRGGGLAEVLSFTEALIVLMGREPVREHWGPIRRFTFPATTDVGE
jgi:hypothetical protein